MKGILRLFRVRHSPAVFESQIVSVDLFQHLHNYIDIARSTQVGESSLARNDYQVLSKQVLARILELSAAMDSTLFD